jgi:hypothetical protein
METKQISLRQERELGAILSDGFMFLKENYKSIFRVLYRTSLIPFILYLVAVAITASYQSPISSVILEWELTYAIGFVVMVLAGLAYNVLAASSVWGYMKQYTIEGKALNEGMVVRHTFNGAIKLLGFTIIAGIILFFGFMFFFLPGVYLSVPLYLSGVVIVMENKNLSNGLSRGFELVKGEWWVTFGTILAIIIVMAILSFTFQIPLYAYSILKNFVLVDDEALLTVGGNDVIFVVISVLTNAITYVLFVIHVVFAGLIYFDLDEQKSSTGLFDQIEKLEKTDQ